jgi:hypothetical protein
MANNIDWQETKNCNNCKHGNGLSCKQQQEELISYLNGKFLTEK